MRRNYSVIDLIRYAKTSKERAGAKPIDLIKEYDKLYPELTPKQQWENIKKALGKEKTEELERALANAQTRDSNCNRHGVTNRNLTYKVMLRRCGAINNADGTYTIYETDLKAWFENGDYLKEYTDYDLF